MDKNFSSSTIAFSVSYSLLIFVFCLFLFSFIGFFFHISINIFYPILSMLISLTTLYLCIKSQNLFKKHFLIALIIYILIFVVSLLLGHKFWDTSWDGRVYHQASIMFLGAGWNPVYDNVADFVAKIYNTSVENLIWVETYPKFVEIIQTNIFIFFGNIERAKMTTFLSMFILFGYSFYILSKDTFKRINKFLKIFLSFAIVINPVVIAQMFTYMIDGYVYLYFMLILLAILDIEISKSKNLPAYSIIIMSAVCLINVKLGGLLYVFLPLLLYCIYNIFARQKQNIKYLSISLLVIIVLGLLSGANPYYTNIKQNRHPFYPLAGKEKIDVVKDCTPYSIYSKNNFEKFIISTFSRVDNFMLANTNMRHHIKPPFWVYKSELARLSGHDTRICGFGIFWSGVLILSGILAIFIRFNSKEEKRLFLFVFAMLLTLTAINPYSWWARYAPHLWVVPIFVVICTLISKKTNSLQKFITYIMLALVFSSFVIQTTKVSNIAKNYKKHMKQNVIKKLKTGNQKFKIYHIYDWSFIEKLNENNINYEVVNDEFYQKNKVVFSIMKDAAFLEKRPMYWTYKE